MRANEGGGGVITLEQGEAALAKANAIRFARARVKRQLREHKITLAEAFEYEAVATMTVFDLLLSQHRYGAAKVRRALSLAGMLTGSPSPVPEHKQVDSLTGRQKRALVRACSGETERSAA
ncbi:MAG: hypothetical protein ACRDK4_05150 [Solirubrobacteraceae bacterium]